MLLLGATLERGKDLYVHWQIEVSLGATFERVKDLWMSMDLRICHYGQHSKEGHECPSAERAVVGSKGKRRTCECPRAGRAVAGSNLQKRGGHIYVHGWCIVLSWYSCFVNAIEICDGKFAMGPVGSTQSVANESIH
jgi:hypothetical protein